MFFLFLFHKKWFNSVLVLKIIFCLCSYLPAFIPSSCSISLKKLRNDIIFSSFSLQLGKLFFDLLNHSILFLPKCRHSAYEYLYLIGGYKWFSFLKFHDNLFILYVRCLRRIFNLLDRNTHLPTILILVGNTLIHSESIRVISSQTCLL